MAYPRNGPRRLSLKKRQAGFGKRSCRARGVGGSQASGAPIAPELCENFLFIPGPYGGEAQAVPIDVHGVHVAICKNTLGRNLSMKRVKPRGS